MEEIWRTGWDSNPRDAYTPAGFQDRSIQPLSHLSGGDEHTDIFEILKIQNEVSGLRAGWLTSSSSCLYFLRVHRVIPPHMSPV